MHEMSLCENIREDLEQQAVLHNFSRVKTVWLEIGKLSSVEPEALRFGFDVVMKGSLAEAAKLEIIEVDGQAWCFQCQQNVKIEHRYNGCPLCGAYQVQVNGGEQMRIKELGVV